MPEGARQGHQPKGGTVITIVAEILWLVADWLEDAREQLLDAAGWLVR